MMTRTFLKEFESDVFIRFFIATSYLFLPVSRNELIRINFASWLRGNEKKLFSVCKYLALRLSPRYTKIGRFDLTDGQVQGKVADVLNDCIEFIIFGNYEPNKNRYLSLSEKEKDKVVRVFNTLLDYLNCELDSDILIEAINFYNDLMVNKKLINRFEATEKEKNNYAKTVADKLFKIKIINSFSKYSKKYESSVLNGLKASHFTKIFDLEKTLEDFEKDPSSISNIEKVTKCLREISFRDTYSEDGLVHYNFPPGNDKRVEKPYYLWEVEAITKGSQMYFESFEIRDLIEIGAVDTINLIKTRTIESENIPAGFELNKVVPFINELNNQTLLYGINFLNCFYWETENLKKARDFLPYIQNNFSIENKNILYKEIINSNSKFRHSNLYECLFNKARKIKVYGI